MIQHPLSPRRIPSSVVEPEIWLRHLFSAKAAIDGGVVRRKVRDVERIVGRHAFESEVLRRGFRAVRNGGQYVIFCNRDEMRLIE
ncbi:N-(5'-phosphoribosyl)anthranilate isomerase [uncultured Jannaschia sp.]|uniref:N-(5'-phosphoribosyl)anthranilate isomerase n=1 Tax=uncultured Jannaschia sp. TaxID=293347 RepID=UPI00260735BC|nr:N-(5'-phosphoribosyl)anthranilate isomerase [uncultured Jannaschia sp.]